MKASYTQIEKMAADLAAPGRTPRLEIAVFHDPTVTTKVLVPLGFEPCARLWLHQHETDSRGDADKVGDVVMRVIYIPPAEAKAGRSDMSPELDPVDFEGSGFNDWAKQMAAPSL